MEIKDPRGIEKRSMEIISKEIGEMDCLFEEEAVIKRIIHSTADLDFAQLVTISPDAVKRGISSLKGGASVVTDVSMVKAGVNKRVISKLGGRVITFIADRDIAELAKKEGVTRSIIAMRKAVKDKKNRIFLIGNAPTALFELIRLVKEGLADIDLIIGTPVGFVGASESKEELIKTDIPYITVRGRKGGSPVAAAALNAILYQISDSR
ncbi:MAG: precorrin-8X methylmutase [Halanaerobiaceae bacterium]